MALVLPEADVDDIICIFIGAKTPYLLRPCAIQSSPRKYQLVGEVYLHGFMDGSVIAQCGSRIEDIYLT